MDFGLPDGKGGQSAVREPLEENAAMSYHDTKPHTRAGKIGKAIYMEALSDRCGFRDDQLGIEDVEIWDEIFTAIGNAAISAVAQKRLAR